MMHEWDRESFLPCFCHFQATIVTQFTENNPNTYSRKQKQETSSKQMTSPSSNKRPADSSGTTSGSKKKARKSPQTKSPTVNEECLKAFANLQQNTKSRRSKKPKAAFQRRANIVNFLYRRFNNDKLIVAFYAHRPDSTEKAAFTKAIEMAAEEDDTIMDELVIHLIECRRDNKIGEFIPREPTGEQSQWPWMQMISIMPLDVTIGDDQLPQLALMCAETFVRNINVVAARVPHKYNAPTFRLGEDVSDQYDPDSPIDNIFLDTAVVQVVEEAYPDKSLDELIADEGLMRACFRGSKPAQDYQDAKRELDESREEEEED